MVDPDDEEIAEFLSKACNIAVVGWSHDPSRPSREVAAYLRENGYRVFPVNPALRSPPPGERVYASLGEIEETIDIVDVFRRPEHVPEVARDALRTRAPVFWMQTGIDHPEARGMLLAAGRHVVANRCIKVEHARLIALRGV